MLLVITPTMADESGSVVVKGEKVVKVMPKIPN